jgi:hypothetical protein
VGSAAVVASEFLGRMLEYDFPSLYRSYENPMRVVAGYFAGCYGWATLVLSCAGFAAAAFSPRVARRRAGFVLVVAGLAWLEWLLVVRQLGEQYTLHFTPAIVLGLVLLVLAPLPGRVLALQAVAAALVLATSLASFAIGLWGKPSVPYGVARLFARGWTPLVRSDYSEVAELVKTLRAHGGSESPIYVVGSSASTPGCCAPRTATWPGRRARSRCSRFPRSTRRPTTR